MSGALSKGMPSAVPQYQQHLKAGIVDAIANMNKNHLMQSLQGYIKVELKAQSSFIE